VLFRSVKNVFRPEFLNRVDMVVVFRALGKADVLRIVDIELRRIEKQLQDQQLELHITEDAKELLADKGFDPDFGARPLRRVIQNIIEDELAERLLAGKLKAGGKVSVSRAENEIAIETTLPEEGEGSEQPQEPQPELAGSAS
jgi:ATP-dependent Clp protease ATP-binding subunit ClpA